MNNGEWPPEKESVHRVQPEVGVPFESKEAKHIAVPLCVQIWLIAESPISNKYLHCIENTHISNIELA